tara:strand:- start:2529 stop:3113 length:585 start_codon:yes stop_codon:yes gene_type:complete
MNENPSYDQPDWLKALKSSDVRCKNKAFVCMMDKWQKPIYSHLLQLLGNHEDAADASQETFIQVLKSIDGFEQRSKFSTWLYTIAHRKGIESLRKKSRLLRKVSADDTALANATSAASDVHGLDAEKIMALLDRAVSELPTRQRQVFLLHYFEGQTFNEIATITGVTIGALKASFHHARKKIEKALAQRNINFD